MNSRLVIHFITILIACLNVTASVTNPPVRTNFVADAILSADEMDLVVKFAKSRGFGEVAEVKTFHYLPTLYRGILVTSQEKAIGRKITYKTLEIFREEWSWKTKPKGAGQVTSMGKFWVEGLDGWPKEIELTTFATSKGIIRVRVEDEIPIASADEIIKRFTTGKILYANEFDKGTAEHINFSRPNRLRISRKDDPGAETHYWISFSESNDQIEFVLSKNDVKVVSVVHVQI